MNKDINQNMANINAYKMDGLGNNFLIIDRRQNFLEINKSKIIDLVKRNIIPFDQLITLEKEEENAYPIKIFNSDGIETSACGNGVRCIAYLISQENKKNKLSIKTNERLLKAEITGKQNVKINMGKAKFNWNEIPLNQELDTTKIKIDFLNKEYGNGFCLNVGNPHIIYFVKNCDDINLKEIGPKIENYKLFPNRINVTFAQIIEKNIIKINVWERGDGQTKACGTAACATTVAASKKSLINSQKESTISFKEGNLYIRYDKEIFMSGPVSEIKKINLEV